MLIWYRDYYCSFSINFVKLIKGKKILLGFFAAQFLVKKVKLLSFDLEQTYGSGWRKFHLDSKKIQSTSFLFSCLHNYFVLQTMFDAPEGNGPVAIDLGSMGKGQAWVNGHLIGRYWSLVAPESGCPASCNYAGTYGDSKCRSNCGIATQSWY